MVKPQVSQFDVAQFMFRFFLLALIDCIKIIFGQSWKLFFINIIFYFFYLLSTSLLNYSSPRNLIKYSNKSISSKLKFKVNFFFSIILVTNIAELISYLFMNAPLNTQALNALNINAIIKEFSFFLYYFLAILLFCFAINYFPFIKRMIKIPKITFFIHYFTIFYGFLFLMSILKAFHDENNQSLLDSQDYNKWLKKLLYAKFDQKPKILEISSNAKNLILLQLESYPYIYASNPNICPNLYNFSKRFEYIGPIQSVPYSTWSIGATVLLQTGIPQIFPDTDWKFLSKHNINYISEIKGIPDILSSNGYKLQYATKGKNSIMGFNAWILSRNYKRILTTQNDEDLFNFFIDKYLAEMDKDIRNSQKKSKYLVFIVNLESHLPYSKPKWCNLQFPEIEEKQKCFYCIDHLIGKFVNKFLDLKMDEHTLLAVFPDHFPSMLTTNPAIKDLFFLFPGIPKVDPKLKFHADVTYYDFAPTVLDLIGIKKYVPVFPFGRNIYFDQRNLTNISSVDLFSKHPKPDSNDLAIIYKLLHYEKGKLIGSRYDLNRKFKCYNMMKTSWNYSDKPCN